MPLSIDVRVRFWLAELHAHPVIGDKPVALVDALIASIRFEGFVLVLVARVDAFLDICFAYLDSVPMIFVACRPAIACLCGVLVSAVRDTLPVLDEGNIVWTLVNAQKHWLIVDCG